MSIRWSWNAWIEKTEHPAKCQKEDKRMSEEFRYQNSLALTVFEMILYAVILVLFLMWHL